MPGKDIFYDTLANPSATLYDLSSVGHGTNSVLLTPDEYKKNQKVIDYFTENGQFNEDKFNTAYKTALFEYSQLTDADSKINILNSVGYDPSNRYISPEVKRLDVSPAIFRSSNPDHTTIGMEHFGFEGERKMSRDELAQASGYVLSNPVAVSKGANAEWEKLGIGLFNPDFWKDFFKTRVLAQYEEDGEHTDPITGETVQHRKGDLKLNPNGDYYYENLDGRDVYGKQVLNKLNILSVDGSKANKFDFFDSDDLNEKSIGATAMKNLFLVGSMFIPYVGWGIAGLSVLTQGAGLAAVLGKMGSRVLGNDNPEFLNNLEGFTHSVNRMYAKSEYAQEHPWSWENLIDMAGDVAGQLREQRAIFKYVPAIFKGKWGVDQTQAGYDALKAKYTNDITSRIMSGNASVQDVYKQLFHKGVSAKTFKDFTAYNTAISEYSNGLVNQYFKSYNKLGEQIARTYMTAITVQDTYGEALQAGATSNEATMLTLGYAFLENKLLKSDIGRWIYPELRADKMRYKGIVKGLNLIDPETRAIGNNLRTATTEQKNTWISKLFKTGQKIASLDYTTKGGIGMAIAGGLAEGFEEVSEEILADFSKGCFNLASQLKLTSSPNAKFEIFTSPSDTFTRYALNFLGGFGGGAVNSFSLNYKQRPTFEYKTQQEALKEIIRMAQNNELDDFYKWLDKTEVANKNLSATPNNEGIFGPGTDADNQDKFVKDTIKKQVALITETLEANHADLADDSVIKKVLEVLPELQNYDVVRSLRYQAFAQSLTADAMLDDWRKACADIVTASNQIENLYKSKQDHAEFTEEQKRQLKIAENNLKDAISRKDAIMNGKRDAEFMQSVLFETNPSVSGEFTLLNPVQYIELVEGKRIEEIDPERVKELTSSYENWKSQEKKAQIRDLARYWWNLMDTYTEAFQKQYDYFKQVVGGQLTDVKAINDIAAKKLTIISNLLQQGEDPVEDVQKLIASFNQGFNTSTNEAPIQATELFSQNLIDQFKAIDENPDLDNDAKQDAKYNLIFDDIVNPLDTLLDSFLNDVKFIHPEVKHNIEQLINGAVRSLEEYASYTLDEDLSDSLYERSSQLSTKLEQIKALPYTPLISMLEQFVVNLDTKSNVVSLIEAAINQEVSNETGLYNLFLNSKTVADFDEAIKVLKLFRSIIAGSQYDNMDIDNLSGNTRTMNAVGKTPWQKSEKFVEIDEQTAQLALIDIDSAINRLEVIQQINALNSGNKLNLQNNTSINKNYIFYNRMQKFITDLDDQLAKPDSEIKKYITPESFAKLKEAFTAMDIHEKGTNSKVKDRKFDLTQEERNKLSQEAFNLQNAIYDFFSENSVLLTNANALKELVKPFSWFTNKVEVLTKDTESVGDSVFMWWLASNAALRASDFYSVYKDVLHSQSKDLAPIPTQELGIYAGIAAIYNGNVFSTFAKASREAIHQAWIDMSEDSRRNIAKEINAQDAVAGTDVDNIYRNDIMPNFQNILFIEGIPGSGKTFAVLNTIFQILQHNMPQEFIGKKFWLAQTTKENAQKIVDKFDISPELKGQIETFDHDSLLKYIFTDWSTKTGRNGNSYEYVEGVHGVMTKYGFNPSWQQVAFSEKDIPAVIFVDEWSQYTQPEAAALNRFARAYGIQIIATGDYDQTGPLANYNDGTKVTHTLSGARQSHPYGLKLGVSMRTDNGQKSANLQTMQAYYIQFQNNPAKQTIKLRYADTREGLFGDQVISTIDFNGQTDTEISKIKVVIDKMIATLKPNEKIGFIQSDPNSKLSQFINSAAYKQYFMEPEPVQKAQGFEARYYVVEAFTPTESDQLVKSDLYFKTVYTGASRAEQFSLIVTPGNSNTLFDFSSGTAEAEVIKESFTEKGIERYKKGILQLLESYNLPPITLALRKRDRKAEFATPISTEPNTEPTAEHTYTLNPAQPVGTNELTPESLQPGTTLYNSEGEATEVVTVIDNQVTLSNTIENADGTSTTETHQESIDTVLTTYTTSGLAPLYEENQYITLKTNDGSTSDIYLIKKVNIIDDQIQYELENVKTNAVLTVIENDIAGLEDYQLSESSINPPTNEGEAIEGTGFTYNEITLEELPDETFGDISLTNTGDIAWTLGSESFNVRDLGENGIEFDNVGNVISQNIRNSYRIDGTYGLHRLEPSIFNNKAIIQDTMTRIEQLAYYEKDNAKLLEGIKTILSDAGVTTINQNTTLNLSWVFMARANNNVAQNQGKYSRYNRGKTVPLHSVNLILSDANNVPFLEIPCVSLSNPLTLLYKFAHNNPTHPVAIQWNSLKSQNIPITSKLETIQRALVNIGKPGFSQLANLCYLWRVTSNIVIPLGNSTNPWNLATVSTNLGNHIIKQRDASEVTQNGIPSSNYITYTGEYTSLSNLQSIQVLSISHVMETMTEYYEDSSGNSFRIASPSYPFVLVSSDPKYKNDTQLANTEIMMADYLKQITSGNQHPTIKLVYVTPPQVTIKQYLEEQMKVWKQDKTTKVINPYGNKMTPLRLLYALYKNKNNPEVSNLLERLKVGSLVSYSLVEEILEKEAKLLQENPRVANNYEINHKLVKLENDLLNEYVDNIIQLTPDKQWKQSLTAGYALNKALQSMFIVRQGNDNVIDNNAIAVLDKIAKQEGITGILVHPHLYASNIPIYGSKIAGYSNLVKVNNINDSKNRFIVEGLSNGQEFSIFGKITTPRFDLTNSLVTSGFIYSFLQGVNQIGSLYQYNQPNACSWYEQAETPAFKEQPTTTAEPVQQPQPAQTSKQRHSRTYSNLLGKLPKDDYTKERLESIPDNIGEIEFLQEIASIWHHYPNNIAIPTAKGIKHSLILTNLLNGENSNIPQVNAITGWVTQSCSIVENTNLYNIVFKNPSTQEEKTIRAILNADETILTLELDALSSETTSQQPISSQPKEFYKDAFDELMTLCEGISEESVNKIKGIFNNNDLDFETIKSQIREVIEGDEMLTGVFEDPDINLPWEITNTESNEDNFTCSIYNYTIKL